MPLLGFSHVAPNPQRQERWRHADEEDAAPAEARNILHEPVHDSREHESDRPCALHEAERFAAMTIRIRLRDEGGAARPLTAHAEAEKNAEDRELERRHRKPGGGS